MNTADNKIKDEKEFTELMKGLVERYEKAFKLLENDIVTMEKKQGEFPRHYISNDKHEDLMIKASELKHKAISTHSKSMGILAALESDVDYYEGQILLFFADEFLKEKFDKVTDLLRNSYISSNRHFRTLKKLRGKLKPLAKQAENLIEAFSSDEVNFRKFLEIKTKLKGI